MFEPMAPSTGGPLPDRGRRRNAVNLLLCVAGLAGLVLGGWALYGSYQSWQHRGESRTAISEACAQLLDADAVMRLDGGRDRVLVSAVESKAHLDLGRLPDGCELGTVRDRNGDRDLKAYFSLKVHALPQEGLHVLDPQDEPFRRRPVVRAGEDVTDRVSDPLPAPLGDGGAGSYSARTVSVETVCAPSAAGVTSVRASATAQYGDPNDKDRRALASIARTAAFNAARRIGCATTPPDLPASLPAQGRDLGPAERGAGSCAWYAAFLRGRQDRDRLPDRALGAPVTERGGSEYCVLALGTDTRRGIYAGLLAEGVKAGGPSDFTTNPWWLRTYSYFGDDATGTKIKPFVGELTGISAGRAQRENLVMYASATCQGRPALFGMTTAYRYDAVLGPRLDEVFTAYATEAATRRGCTGLVLPGPE